MPLQLGTTDKVVTTGDQLTLSALKANNRALSIYLCMILNSLWTSVSIWAHTKIIKASNNLECLTKATQFRLISLDLKAKMAASRESSTVDRQLNSRLCRCICTLLQNIPSMDTILMLSCILCTCILMELSVVFLVCFLIVKRVETLTMY